MAFHKNILEIDSEKETERIRRFIEQHTLSMKRDGAIVGLSGGIDSSLCLELCVRALGKERVFGLILPERESNPMSREYALKQARKTGAEAEAVDIVPTLERFGTYDKRDKIVKEIFPEYDSQCQLKITLPPDLLSRNALNFFTLTMKDGKGNVRSARLNKERLNGIVAAMNTKQRTRMMHLYYYAEKMNYLVCGTTNRSEMIQGFFVKYGDGGVDIEPIAHLYKTQVYQLSDHVDVIKEVIQRMPSPDTFSFEVGDEEFYFRMPFDKLDLLLYAWENKVSTEEVCQVMSLSQDQVKRAFRDFWSKYKATNHLRKLPPSLLLEV